MEESPKCWACQSSITLEQKKCTSCGSWLNWRRHMVLSSSALALVVAALGLTTALVSIVQETAPKGVLVSIAFGETNPAKIEFFNWLEFPVTLTSITCDLSGTVEFPSGPIETDVFYKVALEDKSYPVWANLTSQNAHAVLPPHKSVVMDIDFVGSGPSFEGFNIQSGEIKDYHLMHMISHVRAGNDFWPSNIGFPRYNPSADIPCTFIAIKPDGTTFSQQFENPNIKADIEGNFASWWSEAVAFVAANP